MRLPYYIEAVKKEEKSSFTFDDITNVLFFNNPPSIIVKPFNHLQSLKYISLTFAVVITYRESLLKRISNSIIKFNNCKIDNVENKILKLPHWVYVIILKEYERISNQWINYFVDNIKDYCEKVEISKLNWSSIKLGLPSSFIKEEPTIEQKIWIKVNQSLDKKEMADYVEEVRKSLLPWLNSDLYREIKKKENTRVNVNYEKNRESMLKDEFDYKTKEDLDIIE